MTLKLFCLDCPKSLVMFPDLPRGNDELTHHVVKTTESKCPQCHKMWTMYELINDRKPESD